MKIIKARVPIFESLLWIYVGEDLADEYSKALVKRYGVTEENSKLDGCDGRCHGSLIWVRRPSIRIFSHEIVHFVDMMADHVGVKDENGEFKAYVVGWCMDKLWPKVSVASTVENTVNLEIEGDVLGDNVEALA